MLSVLLPGLDGTGELFEPFVASAPSGFAMQSCRLPSDRPRSYAELADWVKSQLPEEPVALIAESFSGPLAVLVADQCPNVLAVVLCASFVKAPLPALFGGLPAFVWRQPPPSAALSIFLTGGDLVLASSIRRALAGIGADIIAARISAALRVDVSVELQRLSQPLLCLSANEDLVVGGHNLERIRALKPSAQFVAMQGPHLLLQKRPAEAWRHIKPFLERAQCQRMAGDDDVG